MSVTSFNYFTINLNKIPKCTYKQEESFIQTIHFLIQVWVFSIPISITPTTFFFTFIQVFTIFWNLDLPIVYALYCINKSFQLLCFALHCDFVGNIWFKFVMPLEL